MAGGIGNDPDARQTPITNACHDRRDTAEREQSSSKRGESQTVGGRNGGAVAGDGALMLAGKP